MTASFHLEVSQAQTASGEGQTQTRVKCKSNFYLLSLLQFKNLNNGSKLGGKFLREGLKNSEISEGRGSDQIGTETQISTIFFIEAVPNFYI